MHLLHEIKMVMKLCLLICMSRLKRSVQLCCCHICLDTSQMLRDIVFLELPLPEIWLDFEPDVPARKGKTRSHVVPMNCMQFIAVPMQTQRLGNQWTYYVTPDTSWSFTFTVSDRFLPTLLTCIFSSFQISFKRRIYHKHLVFVLKSLQSSFALHLLVNFANKVLVR